MPTMRVPVEMSWAGVSGSPGANIWHVRTTADITSPPELESNTELIRQFYEDIASLYCSDLVLRYEGEATGVGDDTGNIYTSPPWTVTGTTGLDHLAPALQMMVQWRGETGGPHGRGRTFIGPLSTACHQDNGTPDEAERTVLIDAAAALVEGSDSFADGAVGIWSRTELVFRDVVSSAVPNKFAILRSRRD
jgi:hypothetical protein